MLSKDERVKDIFEALVRFAGLIAILYGLCWLIGAILGSIIGFGTVGTITLIAVTPSLLALLVGVYLLRGAPFLMKLVFSERR